MCVCAAGKISRVSTLDFAAETWSFVILCVIVFCLSVLSAPRYATHWFLVFGMWLSGGYQRTIRHDYTACKFQYLQFFLTYSHYWFHVFDVQLCFVGAQVLERWLTCVCWHVTWNTRIVFIEIARKCRSTRIFPLFIATYASWEIQKSCLPALRYVIHWFLVFGMWISGGYQRTIRHDYRA